MASFPVLQLMKTTFCGILGSAVLGNETEVDLGHIMACGVVRPIGLGHMESVRG